MSEPPNSSAPARVIPVAERSERRTNLFVSATLSWMQSFSPATIRNLSPGGALVEASVLPTPGASVQLTRGSLRIEGLIIWREGRRAGLQFIDRIVVADWLPSGSSLAQARVDQAIHAVKSGVENEHLKAISSPIGVPRTLLEEVGELQALLGVVAEGLAEDYAVVAEHGEELQVLDMIRQRFGRLSEGMGRI